MDRSARLVVRCQVTRALARDELLARFEAFAASATDEEQIALLVRLDGLSEVNRLEGIAAGDVLLRELACRLAALEGVRSTGRYSSATFGLLASPASAWELARVVAHTVDEALTELSGARTSFHVGLARPVRVGTGDALCVALDDALASARTAGRGSVIEASVAACDESVPRARPRASRVLLVEDSVDLRTLVPTHRSEIVSYERTSSGDLRRVRTETAESLLDAELEVSTAGLVALSRGPVARALCTNLSRVTLADPRARAELLEVVVASGISGERWGFEVDEQTALSLPDETSHFAASLASFGSSLVVDGFVGEVPTALAGMPLAGLKLDEARFAGLPEDPDARDALERAVSSAAELRLPLGATRLVHGRSREMLVASGITVGQGPWLRPLRVLG